MQEDRANTEELFLPGQDFPFVGKDCYRRVLRSMADESAFDNNGCTFPDLPPVADESSKEHNGVQERNGSRGMVVPCPGDIDDRYTPRIRSHSSTPSEGKLERSLENIDIGEEQMRHCILEAFSEGLQTLRKEHKTFLHQMDHTMRVGASRMTNGQTHNRKLSLGSADAKNSLGSGDNFTKMYSSHNTPSPLTTKTFKSSGDVQFPSATSKPEDDFASNGTGSETNSNAEKLVSMMMRQPALVGVLQNGATFSASTSSESRRCLNVRRSHRHRPSYHIDLMQRRISVELKHAKRKEIIASMCHCIKWCIPQRFTRFVKSQKFNIVCSFIMFLFAGTVGYEADLKIRTALSGEPEPAWTDKATFFFNVFFAVEVLARILGESSDFFIGRDWRWNIFDLSLVLLSAIEMLGDGIKLSFFRVLRTLKVVRVIRVVRVVRWFHELRILLTSILASLASLVWTLLFLGLFTFLSSTAIMQGAANYIREDTAGRISFEFRSELELYFPNIYTSMYTLIGSICGGEDWLVVARPLWKAGALYGCIFVAFVLTSVLGILNVVTSMFVERASSLKKMDRDFAIAEEMTSMRSDIKDTLELFKVLDPDNQGKVDLAVLEEFLMEDQIVAHFATLGIDVTDQGRIAHLLDPYNDGSIGLKEFVAGCIGLRGGSNKMDSMITLEILRDVRATIDMLAEDVDQLKELCAKDPQRRSTRVSTENVRSSIKTMDKEVRSSIKTMDKEALGDKK